jgi:hypothetical protein
MIQPQRAAVRPRVRHTAGGEVVLLEDEIAALLAAGESGFVALLGAAGSGKTRALQHLADVFADDPRLVVQDVPDVPPSLPHSSPAELIVYTAEILLSTSHLAIYRLAPWGRDELIEYLLAAHRSRCASVMTRLQPSDYALLGGVPGLWSAVLDRLAQDDNLAAARSALQRYVGEQIDDPAAMNRARQGCLAAAVTAAADVGEVPLPADLAPEASRLLRYPAVQLLLAAEGIAVDLRSEEDCDWLLTRLPRELVRSAGALVASDESARANLERLLSGPVSHVPMVASLLHASQPDWIPPSDMKTSTVCAGPASRWRAPIWKQPT